MFQRIKRGFIPSGIILFAITLPAWAQVEEEVPDDLKWDVEYWLKVNEISLNHEMFRIYFREGEKYKPLPGATEAEKTALAKAALDEALANGRVANNLFSKLIRDIAKHWRGPAEDKGILPPTQSPRRYLSQNVLLRLEAIFAASNNPELIRQLPSLRAALKAQEEAFRDDKPYRSISSFQRRLPSEKLPDHIPDFAALNAAAKVAKHHLENTIADYYDPTRADRVPRPQLPEDPSETAWKFLLREGVLSNRRLSGMDYLAFRDAIQYVTEQKPSIGSNEAQTALDNATEAGKAAKARHSKVHYQVAETLVPMAQAEKLLPLNYPQEYVEKGIIDKLYEKIPPGDPRRPILEAARSAIERATPADTVYHRTFPEQLKGKFQPLEEAAARMPDPFIKQVVNAAEYFYGVHLAKLAEAAGDEAELARVNLPATVPQGPEEATPLAEKNSPPPPGRLPPPVIDDPLAPVLLPRITAASVRPALEPATVQLALPAPKELAQLEYFGPSPKQSPLSPISPPTLPSPTLKPNVTTTAKIVGSIPNGSTRIGPIGLGTAKLLVMTRPLLDVAVQELESEGEEFPAAGDSFAKLLTKVPIIGYVVRAHLEEVEAAGNTVAQYTPYQLYEIVTGKDLHGAKKNAYGIYILAPAPPPIPLVASFPPLQPVGQFISSEKAVELLKTLGQDDYWVNGKKQTLLIPPIPLHPEQLHFLPSSLHLPTSVSPQ